MNTYLDIETIPNPDNFQVYLDDALNNFKAPSSLTKTKACIDLGLETNTKASADEVKKMWEERFAKEKAPEVAEENFRKESFDGAKGQVCSISFALKDSAPVVFCRDDSLTEKDILGAFFDVMRNVEKEGKPFFIGHYIAGFDLKFLFHRAVVNNIRPVDLPFSGRHGIDYFCTMHAWCGYGERISQDNLCAALGIEGKQGMDGSQVWDAFKEKRFSDIANYNKRDVEIVRELHKRLTFRG